MQDKLQEFWFNTRTNQVEVGKQTLAIYRLGPFASRQEAERAPEIIAARAAEWREEENSEKD
ncbi:MAG: SPOR domain-containing protein [Rhodoluna sp.]